MSRDTMVVCYEGIQRHYRNAVVRLIRSTFTREFPNDYVEKLRALFQKEWETARKNAHISRQSGEVSSPISDDFDILGVNHFYNIFEKYYDIFFVSEISLEDSGKKDRKQALLRWMKTIKNLRDPLAHPAEEAFPRDDAYQLLDSARRVLEQLQLPSEASDIKNLIEELLGTAMEIAREPLESQLPYRESIVVNFVGRKREQENLWSWFVDPHSRRWALAGEGGKGKSALAYNFAIEVTTKAPEPFEAVFWLSAKKRRFVEGQTVSTTPEFSDLDTALSCLLTYYGWIDEIDKPVAHKRARLLELFNEFPALVVVDDIDSLQSEAEDAIEFFSLYLPNTKSKVLFTSRRIIFGMGGATTHIAGFTEEEAKEFIFSRCENMKLDQTLFGQGRTKRICRVTEGSPLYIEDLMRLSASLGSIDEVIRVWEARGGNEARKYALGRECDLLSPTARKVLMAACISPAAVSFAEIEMVTALPSAMVSSALQELQRLFLVPQPKTVEGEQRFEVNINTKALVRETYGSDAVFVKIEKVYKSLSGELPKSAKGTVGAIIRQAMFLQKTKRYTEAAQLLLGAIERYPGEADLYGVLGRVYSNWSLPKVTDARENFQRAWRLKCSKSEMYDIWCAMEISEHEWTKAKDVAEKGLKRFPNNKRLLYFAGYARSRLARELRKGFQSSRAKKEIVEACKFLEESLSLARTFDARERSLNASTYRALVLAYEMLDEREKVDSYFQDWFAEHPDDTNALSEWKRISRNWSLTARPPVLE